MAKKKTQPPPGYFQARWRKLRRMNSSQIVATVLGLFITATFVITLVIPNVSSSSNTNTEDLDFLTPESQSSDTDNNDPLPVADGIEGNPPHLHNSGLFQSFAPLGNWWIHFQDSYLTEENRASTIFRGQCAVLHTIVELGMNYDTPQALADELFTETYFDTEWDQYPAWEITGQRFEDEYAIYDFKLEGDRTSPSCPVDYLGRQISWIEDSYLLTVRIVVPDDDGASLNKINELALAPIVVYPHMIPLLEQNWLARVSADDLAMMVLPPAWETTEQSGLAQTFTGTEDMTGYRATMLTYAATPLESMEDAEAWLARLRPTAEFFDTNETVDDQEFSSGYRLSYTYADIDGNTFSAVAALLNDSAGNLYVAELITPGRDINFLAEEPADETIANAQLMIRSFTVLAPVEEAVQE